MHCSIASLGLTLPKSKPNYYLKIGTKFLSKNNENYLIVDGFRSISKGPTEEKVY